MEKIKKKIRESVEKSYRVPSKSEHGKWYDVIEIRGKLKCNCIAGSMNKPCSHIKIIKLWR